MNHPMGHMNYCKHSGNRIEIEKDTPGQIALELFFFSTEGKALKINSNMVP